MKKKLFTSILICITVIAVFVSGCAQETGSIQVTTFPTSTGEQGTLKPVQSSIALLPSKTAETTGTQNPLFSEKTTSTPAKTAESASTGIPLPSGEITDETFKADIDSDRNEETISFNSKEIEDDDGGVDYLTKMTVSNGKKTYTENIESYTYAFSHFISTQSGKVCLLVGLEGYADYSSELYSFKGIKPFHLYSLGHITGVSGTDITEVGAVDVFGTWEYSRTYKLNDDLSLEPEKEYRIMTGDWKNGSWNPPYTKKKLPVELLKNGVYKKSYIDKGKYIIPVSTDGKSYFKFRLEDGTEGRILFTYAKNHDAYDEYDDQYTVCLIDGKSEFEYLKNIEYTDMVY